MINSIQKDKSLFSDLKLITPILEAVSKEGYSSPTPIQLAAIPIVLKGSDLLGIAQTGTGKTAAFSLPMLQNLMRTKGGSTSKTPRALILVPTRELAVQVHQSLEVYGRQLPLKYAVIYGGVGQSPQVKALVQGVDILVATPGRLLDLMNQKFVHLNKVEIFVLDEADRMLDMGFIRDVQRILPLMPPKKQSLFFSATMPKEVQSLADSILRNPEKVSVTPQSTTVEKINQKVMYVNREKKMDLLLHLLKDNNIFKALVFVDMKHMANKVTDVLVKNKITAAAIHGNKSQGARQRAIDDFRSDQLRVLVATDIAARGIDIDGITHVINFDLPHIVESYVHRIGRTARAGTEGHAISFCTGIEKSYLYAIERETRARIDAVIDHPYHSQDSMTANVMSAGRAKGLAEAERKRGHRGGGAGNGNSSKRDFSRSSSRGPRKPSSSSHSSAGPFTSQGSKNSSRPAVSGGNSSAMSFSGNKRSLK